MENKFSSLSEEIRFHVRELLADGKIHSTAEIKQFVKKSMNKDNISDGAFSGSMRDLIAKEPIYSNPKRGYYQMSEKDTVLLVAVEKIIQGAKNDIDIELNKISGLNLNESIFSEVVEVQKIKSKLEEILSELN